MERLLRVIRITICLCNYTLSTGIEPYSAARQLFDPENRRRKTDDMTTSATVLKKTKQFKMSEEDVPFRFGIC